MNEVHLAAFDLNLLLVFDALWSERNVTRAARRIGLTQPALSHALRRLRAQWGDPLFERSPRGMLPTSRAQELAPSILRALELVQGTLARTGAPFDPSTLQRTFTISTTDYGELAVLPRLLARVAAEAPSVNLVIRPAHADRERDLVAGEHDLSIDVGPPSLPGLRSEELFAERFVCVLRLRHKFAREVWTVSEFAALAHVLISPQGAGDGAVDVALRALSKSRRIALRIPHFLVAPLVVAESDYVCTLPARVVEVLGPLGKMVVREPPVPLPGFTIHQLWHERHDHDAPHRWLRGLLRDVTSTPGKPGSHPRRPRKPGRRNPGQPGRVPKKTRRMKNAVALSPARL